MHNLALLIDEYRTVFYWLGWLSLAMFIVSLALVPILLTRIPAGYFVGEKRIFHKKQNNFSYICLWLLRNMLATILILAGIAMLVLPGQGLLTMLVGLFVSDFPGKHALERKIISRQPVFAAINWVRDKRGAEPLQRPDSNV